MMRANALMKANIDALLKARHQSRRDLAKWCRKSDAWISKVMNEDRREFPMKYWDRISDFFGVATYQLLQPGLTPYYERRRAERRTGKDRRLSAMNHHVRESVSATIATLSASDVADLIRWKTLSAEGRAKLEGILQDTLTAEQIAKPAIKASRVAERRTGENPAPTQTRRPEGR